MKTIDAPSFFFLLAWLVVGIVQGNSVCFGGDCKPCGPQYCRDTEKAESLKAEKKARAEASGLPPRLSALYDGLDDCPGCINNAPDWLRLIIVAKQPEKLMNNIEWSREGEKLARKQMRAGKIKEFHIVLGSNCRCCPEDLNKRTDWHPLDQAGRDWNSRLGFYKRMAFSYTSVALLGPTPPDL